MPSSSSTDSFTTEAVDEGLIRIALEKPDHWPESVAASNNIYLLTGDHPAMVNAGHPSQGDQVTKAVRSCGVEVADIERILYTSWSVEVLGGAKNFPGVDHFVASPDMVQPRAYADYIDGRSERLREFGRELAARDPIPEPDIDRLDAFVDRYFPPVPSELDFIPIRGGQIVRAAEAELDVLPSPGPDPGHVAFFDRRRGWLFTGDFAYRGLPYRLDDVQSYFVSLERLIELESDRVMPNRGESRERGSWTLQGGHRFINNFMSNAPSAMYEEPTLVEFARRDWGHVPEDYAEVVLRIEVYRALMRELVRSQMVDAEGEGLDRRYGTDFDDPRAQIRKL